MYNIINKDRILDEHKEYYKNNKEKWKNQQKSKEVDRKAGKKYRVKQKILVINHYGGKCVCCGETNLVFLTIDHINNNGSTHRKEIGSNLARWIIKNQYPIGFQVLCWNCNLGKHLNNGICPHTFNEDWEYEL